MCISEDPPAGTHTDGRHVLPSLLNECSVNFRFVNFFLTGGLGRCGA